MWSVMDPENVKFMIVRNPFDRLVSAYVDRILNKETDQAKHHSRYMKKYERGEGEENPTFAQFLSYIAGSAEIQTICN